jgi:hypothetical protein
MNGARFMDQLVAQVRERKGGPTFSSGLVHAIRMGQAGIQFLGQFDFSNFDKFFSALDRAAFFQYWARLD